MSVLLLKSETTEKYKEALQAASYDAYYLPILGHQLVDQARLQAIVKQGGYSGVIFTSQRGVQAWKEATKVASNPVWTKMPFYVVGPATRDALLDLPQGPVPPPELIIGGEETGRAEKLGKLMVERLAKSSGGNLLYLVGDKRRDVLSGILSDAGIDVEEVLVYETSMAAQFPSQLDIHLSRCLTTPIWIVFFSPSGASYALPHMIAHLSKKYGQLPVAELLEKAKIRLASIGPISADYLQAEHGLHTQAICNQPTPESLILALQQADAKSMSG